VYRKKRDTERREKKGSLLLRRRAVADERGHDANGYTSSHHARGEVGLFDNGEHDDAEQRKREYQRADETDNLHHEGVRLSPPLHQLAVLGFRLELGKKAFRPVFNDISVPIEGGAGSAPPK
jgi:hypothetical protein